MRQSLSWENWVKDNDLDDKDILLSYQTPPNIAMMELSIQGGLKVILGYTATTLEISIRGVWRLLNR